MSRHAEIRHVVVGVDENISANAALEAAMVVAGLFDASLQLVHAVPLEPPILPDVTNAPWEELREAALQRAWQSRAAHVEERFASSRWKDVALRDVLRVVHGRPAHALLEQVGDGADSMIVLGGHRVDGPFEVGSTARTLLGKSSCPVWVQAVPFREIKKLLVPIDMSPHSRLTIATAIDLARRFDASIEVLHAFTPPHIALGAEAWDDVSPRTDEMRAGEQRVFAEFMADVDAGGVELHAEFVDGTPLESILAAQEAAELIVVGTHGRTAFTRAILGTLAWEVLRYAKRGILAVPGPKRAYRA